MQDNSAVSVAPSRFKVVLAEDNPADVNLVRMALRQHAVACDLQVIADGEEAVSFFSNLERHSDLPCPDLLLLDLHLPKRSGSEVLERLRASERCGQTKVLILTSSDAPADPITGERHAALHYFRKSSSLAQFMSLGTMVKEILSTP